MRNVFLVLLAVLAFGVSCGQDGDNGKDGRDGVDGKNGIDGKDGVDGIGIDGKDGEMGPAGPMGPAGAVVIKTTLCTGETEPSSVGTKWWFGYKTLHLEGGSEFVVFNVRYVYQDGNFTSVSKSEIYSQPGVRRLKSANWTVIMEAGEATVSRPDKTVGLDCGSF